MQPSNLGTGIWRQERNEIGSFVDGGTQNLSVQPRWLVGTVERESRNLNIEILAGLVFHLIAARHDARRSRERRTAGVFEGVAGFEPRLLADHARAAHFKQLASRVGDAPMAAHQLYGLGAVIFDRHVVGPDELAI